MEQVSGCPDDLLLGDRAADGTCPRWAYVARHDRVGDPVFLGRGMKRRDLRRHWHLAVSVGLQPCHVRMWAHHDSS